MLQRRESFLAWPGWALIWRSLLLALPVTFWWIFVYHGANWVTEIRSDRVRVHLDAELAMPFVPAFVLGYLSINLMFLAAPFALRSRRELDALALSLAGIVGVAGICFLIFPADLAYPVSDPGAWSALLDIARTFALAHNLAPSLHVAMSCLCLAAYASHCGKLGKTILGLWGVTIAVSTLLIHQHHLLDVLSGLILAVAGKRLIYDPWLKRSPKMQRSPPNQSAGPGPSA